MTATQSGDFLNSVPHADLQKLLHYDPHTGIFYWLVRASNKKPGEVAGCTDKRLGYRYVGVLGVRYLAHRLAWFYVHGRWPTCFIDHIDGDPSNNALANLREATAVQNQQNVNWRGYSEKKSRPYKNPFEANINVNGENVYLGRFKTAEEARAAYVAANLKYFDKFSFLKRGDQSCTTL